MQCVLVLCAGIALTNYVVTPTHMHVVHENMIGGSSVIWFPHIIADSERVIPGYMKISLR